MTEKERIKFIAGIVDSIFREGKSDQELLTLLSSINITIFELMRKSDGEPQHSYVFANVVKNMIESYLKDVMEGKI